MPTPSLKPLPTLPFNAPAGQAGAWGLFDAPLVGRPEPMGATVDATLVRVWPAVGPALKSPTPTCVLWTTCTCLLNVRWIMSDHRVLSPLLLCVFCQCLRPLNMFEECGGGLAMREFGLVHQLHSFQTSLLDVTQIYRRLKSICTFFSPLPLSLSLHLGILTEGAFLTCPINSRAPTTLPYWPAAPSRLASCCLMRMT